MSEENVEIVKALQPPPDVDLTNFFARGDEERAAQGIEAATSLFDALEEGLSEIRWVPEEVIETPTGQFLAFGRMEAAGGASQVPLREPVAIIATLKDGRVSEGNMFVKRTEALEAAGLPE